MCRSSATADLIGEIRYSALDQTNLPICSRKPTSDCVLMLRAPVQGRMGWHCGLAAQSIGTQAMQFNACEFGAQFGDETEAPPGS
jgi:hypothetical protein